MGINEIRKLKEEADKPKEPKKRKPIPKVGKNKKNNPVVGPAELQRWFVDRRNEMTGFCSNCGKRSSKHSNQYFKFSACHILPKAYFPSVSTHPENWVELCFWGDNSCHTNMDNSTLDLTEMACWDEIVVKFQILYPLLTQKEKARVPDIFLQYLNTDK
jgi:hypothetical protein